MQSNASRIAGCIRRPAGRHWAVTGRRRAERRRTAAWGCPTDCCCRCETGCRWAATNLQRSATDLRPTRSSDAESRDLCPASSPTGTSHTRLLLSSASYRASAYIGATTMGTGETGPPTFRLGDQQCIGLPNFLALVFKSKKFHSKYCYLSMRLSHSTSITPHFTDILGNNQPATVERLRLGLSDRLLLPLRRAAAGCRV